MKIASETLLCWIVLPVWMIQAPESAARMSAAGKLGCYVPFDSIQQADETYEALHFHVEPSHPPSLQ